MHRFKAEEFELYRPQCETVKVCAGAGDLILWDSRTVHWNYSPSGERARLATCVCYCPRKMANEEAIPGEVVEGEEGVDSCSAQRDDGEGTGVTVEAARRQRGRMVKAAEA